MIKRLSKSLTEIYGKGFTKSNLYSFYSFYKCFPQIFQTVSGKFRTLLSWSHYAVLIQVKDETVRERYTNEAAEQNWSVRTLQRNISSQYYYRLLKSQQKEAVESEMKQLTSSLTDKLAFIKNPVVAEFLGFGNDTAFTESPLYVIESAVADYLELYGFDENYKPTEAGKMCEEILDYISGQE